MTNLCLLTVFSEKIEKCSCTWIGWCADNTTWPIPINDKLPFLTNLQLKQTFELLMIHNSRWTNLKLLKCLENFNTTGQNQ